MTIKRFIALILTFAFYLFFSSGSTAISGDDQISSALESAKLSIAGYEGMLEKMDVPDAIEAISALKIGLPPFLKHIEKIQDCGIHSGVGGVLEKGKNQVKIFKLKFESDEQAISKINLKMQKSGLEGIKLLKVEDPKNIRNRDFGLFFDGTSWSGFRREKNVIALMKGDVSQEDIYYIMGKVFGAVEAAAATNPSPIKIGLIGTLSGGPLGMEGLDMRDGALLALKEAAQMEEMKGRSFELVVADDKGDPEEAKKEVRRLIEGEKVSAILGPFNSACALALIPLVSEAGIPMVTLSTNPALTKPLNRYVFRGTISDDDLGRLIADYTTIILGGEKIALFYEDSPYGRAGMEVVRERLRRVGRDPVATESYVSGEIDFGAQMAAFKEAGAKTIVVYGTMMDAQNVMQWIRTSGLDAKVIASSGWASTELLATVPKGLDGVVVAGYTHMVPDSLIYLGPARIVLSPISSGHYQVVTSDLDTDMFPAWTPFYKAFRGAYGRKPNLHAGYAYSNLLSLLDAIKRVEFDSGRIVEALEATENFQTVFNHFINYHDESHDGMRYINFSTYKNSGVGLATKDKSLDATKMREGGVKVEGAGYRGELFPLPVNTAAYFVIHMHYGYPRFMKESRGMGLYGGFRSDYEFYGMKYAYSGTLSKGKERIMMVKMSFRSPDRAIAILDLEATKESLGSNTKLDKRPEEMRDTEAGVSYAEGLWSAYLRKGSKIVFAKGEVPLKNLKAAMETAL